jgi:hypothetical protein
MVDNSKHLIEHQKQELIKKEKAVEEAIKFLMYDNQTININKVSKKAQVSRTFIYNNEKLRGLVEAAKPPSIARAQKHRITIGQARSEESKILIINNLKKRIKDLELEVKTLKSQNDTLRAYIASIEE